MEPKSTRSLITDLVAEGVASGIRGRHSSGSSGVSSAVPYTEAVQS